jgi:type III pantothenate kinase
MLLCIDIGNTNIKLGMFEGERLRCNWRIATERGRLADEYAMLLLDLFASEGLDRQAVTACAISSVVPALTQVFGDLARRHLKIEPVIAGPSTVTGMSVHTDYPAQVGSDLITSALAARHLYGAPVIVIGFGTATTLSAVPAAGDFEGVSIAPGVGTGAEALFQFAAQLPQVELARPPAAIGKNTVHSMQSGLIWGFAALVEGLVKRIRAELGGHARVVATGGLAELIAAETDAIEAVEPDLVLIGLRLIYELNHPPESYRQG